MDAGAVDRDVRWRGFLEPVVYTCVDTSRVSLGQQFQFLIRRYKHWVGKPRLSGRTDRQA